MSFVSNGAELYFGGDVDNLFMHNGGLDEIAFYNTALTPEQVLAHYEAGIGTGELEGDLNDDGFVGSADLDLVRGHWNESVSGPAQGDANGDGTVNSADLDIVRGNWGAGAAAASSAVPEPSMLVLLLGLPLSFALGRRRR